MSEEIILKEVEVAKLRLRPGDVLLLQLPENTKQSFMHRLALHLHKVLPRNPALLIANTAHVSIVSVEDAKEIVNKLKGQTT